VSAPEVGVSLRLLVIEGCPNVQPAAHLVSDVLGELGFSAEVPVEVVRDQESAERLGFVGSPTLLVDGVDPFQVDGGVPAVACRVYATPSGLAGLPDRDALRAVLRSAVSHAQHQRGAGTAG
jgi:hypothetical protein